MLARKCKRLLAMLMAMVMCLGLVSTSALAIELPNGVAEPGTMDGRMFEYHVTNAALDAMKSNAGYDDGVSNVKIVFKDDFSIIEGDSRDMIYNPFAEAYSISFSMTRYDKTGPNSIAKLEVELCSGATFDITEDALKCVLITSSDAVVPIYELELSDSVIPTPKTATVTFDSKGGTPVASQTVEVGDVATKPTDPTKEGFTFVQWMDKNGAAFDFNNTIITEDITLYAKWEEDSGGTQESSTVRFYLYDEAIEHTDYSVTEGDKTFWVKNHYIYLESTVANVAGAQADMTYAGLGNPTLSTSFDSVEELVNAANLKLAETDKLYAADYEGYSYVTENVGWEGDTDQSYHVHIKLTEKSNETGTLHISKSVAGLATIPGVPDNYDVTITVTAEGETEPTYTLSKSNADAGTEGHWFEWTLENVPVGEYTVEETAYSNEFRSGDYIYTLEKTERTNDGAVTVTANGESWVAVTNTYGGAYSPVAPTDNLYFSKSVNYTSAKVGDELTYTIQVHNAGSTAAEVTITDKLADGLTYISADNDAEYDATTNTVSWTGTVAANTTLDLKIVAKINDDQADNTITNVATVNNKTTNQVFTEVEAGSTDPDPDPTPTPTPTPTNPPYVPDDDDDDDDDDPPVVIVDPTTPLGPGTSPEPTTEPTTEPTEEPTEIPEETTPLAPDPGVGDNGDGDDGDADITDGETPLGNLPQTGAVAAPVNPATTAGLVALAFSMAGCGLYFTFGRKKGEEED